MTPFFGHVSTVLSFFMTFFTFSSNPSPLWQNSPDTEHKYYSVLQQWPLEQEQTPTCTCLESCLLHVGLMFYASVPAKAVAGAIVFWSLHLFAPKFKVAVNSQKSPLLVNTISRFIETLCWFFFLSWAKNLGPEDELIRFCGHRSKVMGSLWSVQLIF